MGLVSRCRLEKAGSQLLTAVAELERLEQAGPWAERIAASRTFLVGVPS
jgi:hypothetical protein